MGRLYEMAKPTEKTQNGSEKYKVLGRFLKAEDFSTPIEAKPPERTADKIMAELTEAERRRDEASKKRSNYTGRGSALMYADGAVAAAMNKNASANAEAEFQKYDAKVNALKSELYEIENQSKRKMLEADTVGLEAYGAASGAREDMTKWAQNLLVGPDAGYMEYLREQYGTDNIFEQFGAIRQKQKGAEDQLAELGYDFGRMADYEKRTSLRDERVIEQAENKAFAQEHPVLASAATVPVGVFQGVDYLKMAGREIANDLRGENDWRPSYTDDMYLTNFVSDIRGSVSEELAANTDWELLGENVASFLYNTGMSIADCIATISAAGANAGVLMGGAAAAQTAKTVVESGGTGKQAVVLGLASGAAEMVFEKFSIDNLLKHKDISSAKRLITETLKQGGIEASEEIATEASNILMNTIVMGGQSDFNRTVAYYMSEEGGRMSPDEAKQRALKDCMNQVIMAGVGGFISGGVMGGVSGGAQYAANAIDKKISEAEYSRMIEELEAKAAPVQAEAQTEAPTNVSERGKTVLTADDTDVDIESVSSVHNGKMTYRLTDGRVVSDDAVLHASADEAVVYNTVAELASTPGEANAMIEGYKNSGMSAGDFSKGIRTAHMYGKIGASVTELEGTTAAVGKISPAVRMAAYNAGKKTAGAEVATEQAVVSSEGKTLHRIVDENGVERQAIAELGEVVSVDNKTMTFALADGTTAVSTDLSFSSAEEANFYRVVNTVADTAEEANKLIGGYAESGMSYGQYAAGIEHSYNYGRGSAPKSDLMKLRSVKKLPGEIRDMAYAAGQNLGRKQAEKSEAAVQAKRSRGTKTHKQGSVLFMDGSKRTDFRQQLKDSGKQLNPKQEAAVAEAEMLSKLLGVSFVMYESYTDANGRLVFSDRDGSVRNAPNGFYVSGSGEIHLDLNAGDMGEGLMLHTMGHELTHFIKSWSPAKYRILAEALMAELSESKSMTVPQMVEEQLHKARMNNREPSYDVAYDELVADAMQEILVSGNVVEFMANIKQQDRSLWEKIRDWFRDIVDKLKNVRDAYTGAKPDSPEARVLASIDGALERLEPIFAEALLEAGDNYQMSQPAETKNTDQNGGVDVKYSVRPEFAAELDAWDGKSKITFRVGSTSDVLKRVGVKDTGIIWHGGKISKIMKEHPSMTRDVIKQVPEILENPIIILASKNSDSRLVIFGTVIDAENNPVTAILELMPTTKGGQVMNMNVIASAYGKNNTKNLVESSGLLYMNPDKKRTESWMQSVGLQLPSDANAFGYIGSVSYPDGKVKIDSVPYGQYMQPEKQYSFRSPSSYEKIRQAKQMEREDEDSETIRKETGLFRSYDGMWREEMDDSEMVLSDELKERMLLGELIEHWELFDTYPDMERMIVRFSPMKKGHYGQYSAAYDMIQLNKDLMQDREALKDSLLHEIQHAIQAREGFANGASVGYWEKRLAEGYDGRRRDAIEEEKKYRAEYERIRSEDPVYFEDMMALEKMSPNVPRGRLDPVTWEQVEEDPPEWQRFDEHRDELEARYGEEKVYDFIDLMYHLKRAETMGVRDARTLYYETAGEIEARDTERRRKMSRMERQQRRPNVDYEDAVLYSDRNAAYMDAVNRGDMETAQRMVDEAAMQWGAYLNKTEANEVFRQDGAVRVFYHGTNNGDFTSFDNRLIGSSSGDLGWFGKGFYFAFSYGEAATYGGRVIPAYLKMSNPFDYSQLFEFKGSAKGASKYSRYAWLYNVTKKFPDIVKGQRVWAYPNNGEEGVSVSWEQLVNFMDRIQREEQFFVDEVELSDGDTAYRLRAVPKKESYTNEDGETFEWTEYGMSQLFATEEDAKEPINQIGAYLQNVLGIDSIPRRTIEKIDFSGAVQRAGYDGILQSMSGDEAVVFSPEQIKSADPVTYDDNGDVIPLSKRFDEANPDIRYSDRNPAARKTAAALQQENKRLKEDVKNLRELVRLQKKVTGGKKLERSSVAKVAKLLISSNDIKGDHRELAELLMDVYEYIAAGEELTWEGVTEHARAAVDWMTDHVREDKTLDPYAQEILDTLKGSSVYFSEAQKKEAEYLYDGWGKYRNGIIGALEVSDRSGTSLDQLWHELSTSYPDIFDPTAGDTEMVSLLPEIIDSLRSMRLNVGYSTELLEQGFMNDVYDGYWRASTLYTVADVYQKRIDEMKHKHFDEMKKSKDNLKQTVEELNQQKREAVKDVRAKEKERRKQMTERYRESRENAVESRKITAERNKIKRVIVQLDRLLNKGTKEKHVKEELRGFVAQALHTAEAFFTDEYSNKDLIRNGIGTQMTEKEEDYLESAQEIVEKLDAIDSEIEILRQQVSAPQVVEQIESLMEEAKRLEQQLSYRVGKLKDVLVRERKRLNTTKLNDVINELAGVYKQLENAEGYLRGVYDDYVHQAILAKKVMFEGATVKDMSLAQMKELHDLYTMVLTTVRNANEVFAENLKESRAELATRAMREVHLAGGVHGLRSKVGIKLNAFDWNNLKPVYAFERIGSSTLMQLFKNIRSGEDKWYTNMRDANDFRKSAQKKFKYDTWDMDRQYDFTSASGLNFSLNLDQIMSLYAFSKREQAHDHLMKGGFVFDRDTEVVVEKHGVKMTYVNENARAHTLSFEILEEIIKTLTNDQRAYADVMQEYLSSTMGEKGNEVSMKLYGVKMFGEKFYFPLRSAGQFSEKAKETDMQKQQGQVNLVNSTFAKTTVPHASNSIVLDGFTDVWCDHVNEMSMYNAFVLPLEDFRKVYSFSKPGKAVGDEPISVNSFIQSAYGRAATAYIDQLIKDLNGGALSDNRETIAKRMIALFKKASVFASASVVIQQPMSVARAFAEIDAKYFLGEKMSDGKRKATWDELKKYAPVAGIKEMGYFDTGMGMSAREYLQAEEYSGAKDVAKAVLTDSTYRDELLGRLPALADEAAWCAIWNAVKRETKSNNPKMDVRSEEFLQLCGERFTEIITKTQVYDSVLARSANMRSKTALMSMATSFMGEPTTVANMAESAFRKWRAGDKEGAKRQLGAVLVSTLMTSAAVSLVYAARDDDEDETYLEKYMQSFAVEIVDGINPLTYLPFVKDGWSILQGYDVERADMSLVTDLVNAVEKIVVLKSKNVEDMSDEEFADHKAKLHEAWWGLADYLFAFFGLPVKNVRRDVKGAFNVLKTVGEDLSGRDTTWGSLIDKTWDSVKSSIPVIGRMPSESKQDKLYDAIMRGDTVYADRLKGSYKDDKSLDAAIRKALRANDPRIREAAIAWNAGDNAEYMKIAKEIIAEKKFTQDNIVKAITAEAEKLSPDEGSEPAAAKHVGLFNMDAFGAAVQQGSSGMLSTIRSDIIDTHVRNGKTRDEAVNSFNESAKDKVRDLFMNGEIAERAALNALTGYCGVDKDAAAAKVQYWAFKSKYPDIYVDDSWFDKYHMKVEASGIDIGVYMDYRNRIDGIEGKGMKERILDVIDSMPISSAQKDALYFSEGYAQSTLRKAPWH